MQDDNGFRKVLQDKYNCNNINTEDPSINTSDRKLNYLYDRIMLNTMNRSRNDQTNLEEFLKSIENITQNDLLEVQYWKESTETNEGQPFYLIYQSESMKQLLERYGQEMTQIDATHCINRAEFLFVVFCCFRVIFLRFCFVVFFVLLFGFFCNITSLVSIKCMFCL